VRSPRFFGSVPQGLEDLLMNKLNELAPRNKRPLDLYFDFAIPQVGVESFKVLVLLEPPSVMPENYTAKALKPFDLVIPLSPWRAKMMGLPFFAFQPVEVPNTVLNREIKKSRLVFINALKFGSVSSSLYGWRLDVLRKLQKAGLSVDVYGPNWDMSLIMEFRKRLSATRRALSNEEFDLVEAWKGFCFRPVGILGETSNKFETISRYRFALIIENDKNSLTEKLFDALFSSAIVFYRGPKLQAHTILGRYCYELPEDADLAVQMIQTIIELPETETLHRHVTDLKVKDLAMPFSLENTSISLATAIAASLNS